MFRSELTFTGAVDRSSVTNAAMIYQGQTAVVRAIISQMRLAHDGQVILYVEGKVAVAVTGFGRLKIVSTPVRLVQLSVDQ